MLNSRLLNLRIPCISGEQTDGLGWAPPQEDSLTFYTPGAFGSTQNTLQLFSGNFEDRPKKPYYIFTRWR